jgi:hypothetical protein
MKIEKYKLLIYGFVICALLSYILYSFVLVNKSIEMFSLYGKYDFPEQIETTLLSYPRSGNHLTRFIIEYISGKPTEGCPENKDDKYICTNVFKNKHLLEHVNKRDKPIIIKAHSPGELRKHPKKLIVIIRDPFECISKQTNYKIDNKNISQYLNMLKYYDTYKNEKMLINYKDLMKNPKKVAQNLFNFLNINTDKYLNEFNKNYETIINDSLNIEKVNGGAKSAYANVSKKDEHYHYNKLDEENKNMLKRTLNNSVIYKKYFKI